jgi:signal transduction histidine kinase
MADAELVERLAALPTLREVPREELEWLVAHGRLEVHPVGEIIAPKGERIDRLLIMLSGHVGIRVDRGAGPRRVMGWSRGDVTGMLPYSRMTASPGDNYIEEEAEALSVHEEHFHEMVCRCPAFTAYAVHLMLDRARSFNASDLQDEKMVSLGKLAAGLAHELNNPSSATVRGASLLLVGLTEAEAAAEALASAGLSRGQLDAIKRLRTTCQARSPAPLRTPMEQADREDEIAQWLERHGVEPGYAPSLAETPVETEALDALARELSGTMLDAAIFWIASGCATRSLAGDIERAATRIHGLVAAVKRFTYMDSLAGPEVANVESGLRDTIRVTASKAKSKGASVTLQVDADLPDVRGIGGELNQVWLNLIDNALDAIPEGGHVDIAASQELDRVVVTIADDGPGIPPDVLPRIFDPFFTTKPPGQGTGLGLDIGRRLLRRYHGDIAVESRPGRTEFRVILQLASGGERGE